MSNTGPPYPPLAGPGSNAIGQFEIGISAIGTIPPFDVWNTVISQYANSPILTQLIENIYEYLDQTMNFDEFFDHIWNVDTADGVGLDIWGRIVGVVRTLKVSAGNWFGFAEAQPGSWTFGQGSFFSGEPETDNFELTDSAFRTLIFAKALANITSGSIPAINQILLNLFPHRGNCYVSEGGDEGDWFGFAEGINYQTFGQGTFYNGSPPLGGMKMTYTFQFQLSPVELAIVENSGVLPRPAGVQATTVII